MNILLYLACILLCGLCFGKLAKFAHLPNVTGYLVGGLIIGPSVLRLLPTDVVTELNLVSEMALGFIAFSIGTEFKMSYFKRVGFTPVVIAITEGLGAVVMVVLGLVISGQELPFSLVLGAIASATAPAATIMVIKQYKAKGPVTETLLSVVALDDAVALIAFGFAVTIAKTMTSAEQTNVLLSILEPLKEVGISLLAGAALGFVLAVLLRFFHSRGNRLTIAIAFVFLCSALATVLDASSLLMCMAMGAMFVNCSNAAPDVMKLVDNITPPIFMMFFVVSGAGLQLSVLPTVGLVGIIYIVMRVVGKIAGAWFGAAVMKAPPAVKKYLGPTLVPQAGVAIGLSLLAQTVVPEYADVIRAVVLCGTLIYELVGPLLSKIALTRAGEIAPSAKKKPSAPAKA